MKCTHHTNRFSIWLTHADLLKLKRLVGLCFALTFTAVFPTSLISQHQGFDRLAGKPKTVHFSKSDFKGDPQFWTACQDSSGVMYFGNNDGALIFDGQRWQEVNLPNQASVRGLAFHRGRIYASGYNEIGLIVKNRQGIYAYKSLIDTLGLRDTHLDIVWQLHSVDDKLICRTFHQLLIVQGSNVLSIPSNGSLLFSAVCKGRYYTQDSENGLMWLDLEERKLHLQLAMAEQNGEPIVAILPGDSIDELTLFSRAGNARILYLPQGSITSTHRIIPLSENDQILSAIRRSNGRYTIGLLSGRVIESDQASFASRTRIERTYSDEKTVQFIFEEAGRNIWILENNGLDLIDYASNVETLFDEASVYDALAHGDRVYVATNKGVFSSSKSAGRNDLSSVNFSNIPGLDGQAWSLFEANDQVFVCHDRGLYQLNDDGYLTVDGVFGVWKIIDIPDEQDAYLACTYNGLYLLRRKGSRLQVINKIQGFNESARDIIIGAKEKTYWICHGYIGVFRILLSDDYSRVISVEHFTDKNGLPSHYNVNVFNWQNQLVFTTNEGIYNFDEATARFLPFQKLNQVLNPKANHRQLLQRGELTWFVEDDELGYVNVSEEYPTLKKDPFYTLKGSFNRGMECIKPMEDGTVVVGTTNGLHRIAFVAEKNEALSQTIITQIMASNGKTDSLLTFQSGSDAISLPDGMPSVELYFASPKLNMANGALFSYRVLEIDTTWSAWQSQSIRVLTFVKPGTYLVEVRSKSETGQLAETASMTLSVPFKWYQTPISIALMTLAGLGLLYLGFQLVARKLRSEHLLELEQKAKEEKLLLLEIERLNLEVEKTEMAQLKQVLEENVAEKSKELAYYTMQLVQKKEVLAEVKADLTELRLAVRNDKSKQKVSDIFRKLSQHEIGEDYMSVFDVNFESVHHRFFDMLLLRSPELSKRELRLCAFIKMGLSNKEIAPLLHISMRGVETARYRIRKKLELETDANITEFLNTLILDHP